MTAVCLARGPDHTREPNSLENPGTSCRWAESFRCLVLVPRGADLSERPEFVGTYLIQGGPGRGPSKFGDGVRFVRFLGACSVHGLGPCTLMTLAGGCVLGAAVFMC